MVDCQGLRPGYLHPLPPGAVERCLPGGGGIAVEIDDPSGVPARAPLTLTHMPAAFMPVTTPVIPGQAIDANASAPCGR